ncbi:MAG TPA: hypothetical protein VGQ83_01520, partial [Polyangia bacterium]
MRPITRLIVVLGVLAAAAPAAAGVFRKAPYVQHVTRSSAVVMFELWQPAPAVVRLREVAGRAPAATPAAAAAAAAPGAEWVVRADAAA